MHDRLKARTMTSSRPGWRAIVLVCVLVMAGCGSSMAARSAPVTRGTAATAPPSGNPFPLAGADGNVTCTPTQLAARQAPIIHRPSAVPAGQPAPLLIALHGSGGDAHSMQGLSHFVELADQDGFVVFMPSACDLQHPWGAPQDLTYLSSMITQMTSNPAIAGAIDPARVYVTGFSAGGAETWKAGCQLSRQVAAIAIVSDAMNGQLYSSCKPARPVPQLLMVGTSDGSRYTGIPGRLPDPFQTTSRWRQLDGCPATPTQTTQVGTVREQIWSSCTDGSAVGLYLIQGASHVWPPYGVGAPQDFPTSQEVWAFLRPFRAAPLTLTSGDVRLLSLKVALGRGRRMLVASWATGEPLTIKAVLGPHQRLALLTSLTSTQPSLSTAPGQLTIRVPAKMAAGVYSVVFTIVDTYGRRLTVTRTVHLLRLPITRAHKKPVRAGSG